MCFRKLPYPKIIFLLSVIVITGCSNTRYLAEDQVLYTGADLEIRSEVPVPDAGNLEDELADVIRPEPNRRFLGFYKLRLWFYNIAGEPRGRGLRYWMKNSLGEPPILLDAVDPSSTTNLLINRAQNSGFFNVRAEYEILYKKKSAQLRYIVYPESPFRYREIHFPDPDSELTREIERTEEETILRSGRIYKLSDLREERLRIDMALKDRGFYYFNPDFVQFVADSTIGNNGVDLYLIVGQDTPLPARRRYIINDIYLLPDYSLGGGMDHEPSDTVDTGGIRIISRSNRFRPGILVGSVFLSNGEYYNRHEHRLTINRLMGLGTFRYVNLRFVDSDHNGSPALDAYIYLTPVEENSLRIELRAVSKSNDFAGPGLSAGYRNRNFLKGAELFTADISSGFETQVGGGQSGISSYEIGFETELQIPRIISPFGISATRSMYVPRTKLKFGYNVLNRVDVFRLNSFKFEFGYAWAPRAYIRHEFNPIAVNFVKPGSFSPEFESILTLNPPLRRSFEQQFIIGSTYSFFYNNQIDVQRRNHLYLNLNFDVSGNSLYLVHRLSGNDQPTDDRPYTLFGSPYSQYIRGDIDIRYYVRVGRQARYITRLIAGIGLPYGNSSTLPYVKRFFIGGTNSIRAFGARTLGPGSFIPEDTQSAYFVDRTGDMRIELNAEYRFPLVSIFKGALFIDAGNIWLLRDNPEMPGAQFQADAFLDEIAVGAGCGIRLDASFFVLRFDVAFPIRKPFLPKDERWMLGEIDFGSARWRKDNLVFNIAIGYPF
jgi:outer membrane protein insertion porin family